MEFRFLIKSSAVIYGSPFQVLNSFNVVERRSGIRLAPWAIGTAMIDFNWQKVWCLVVPKFGLIVQG